MREKKNSGIVRVGIMAGIIVAVLLIISSVWNGRSAGRATQEAVHSVSMLYLDELAGRREQVVASNLQNSIENIRTAVSLMDDMDKSDLEHLQAYQSRMKRIYGLEKFAFVDTAGRIYTSKRIQDNIDQYPFDYKTLSKPEISIKNPESAQKTVIIAIPVDPISFRGEKLTVCFMEISMNRMLNGISLHVEDNETTFCNIYTSKGISLANTVLGGLASEDNLLDALKHADFEPGYSAEQVSSDFENNRGGVTTFSYNGIQETLSYVPVEGTDWMLTYLIRESVISDQIGSISNGILTRSLILTLLTMIVIVIFFIVMFYQMRHNARLELEKETTDTENRIKQEELEQRLVLQEQLLEQEKQRVQQNRMITALASDYRSVYYVNLDTDEGICYQASAIDERALLTGERFHFQERFREYAQRYIDEEYRDEFLAFIDPEHINEGLANERVLSCRYLIHRDGREIYEMLRIAGVHPAEDLEGEFEHAVGLGFSDVDRETREALARNQALKDALGAAEEANKAKTVFLSNMSHEIRTPMNAIIGLDNIALNDPDLSPATREYLEKIDSSANHLLMLINDILDMSRIESGRLSIRNEEFSFSKLIEQINTLISGQCAEKHLEYICRIKGEVDDYYIGDDMKLRQVLINILGNAVKFTPEGGQIEFTVERTAHFDGKSAMRFEIRDTGIGMSKDYLPKIFDTFSQENASSTSRYGSSGLGLAITKNIVELMNGKIEVESEKGVGSVFTVTITLLDTAYREREEEMLPSDMSVLVVDDDPVACEHASLVLEKIGIASETALSGKEAIEKVRLRHARREPYNLILVDWKMPEMDGLETTRAIRAITGDQSAIIILTAYKWDDILEDAENAGVDSFLSKPLFASNVMDEYGRARKKKAIREEEETQKAELAGRRILLAEDMEVNAEIITMVLNMREMEVDAATNGREAVEMFTSHPEGYYDAVLMDIRMPEMDGLTAAAKIREMDRADAGSIPIIALTANAFDEDVQRSLQAGMNAHLSKPVEPENLYATLEGLIRP